MLSGLSRKCGLHLLSPASRPVQTTSTTSTYPRGVLAESNEPSALESADEEGSDAVLSVGGPPSAPHHDPAHPSYLLKFSTEERQITRDGNSLELLQRDDENIDALNYKLVTEIEEPCRVVCLDKQSLSSTADIMGASFLEGDRNNQVSGSHCKPLTDNEESGGVISSTFNVVLAAERSSVGIGNNDASMFNVTSVSPSSAFSPFEEFSVPSQDEGGRMKVIDNEGRVDEGPEHVMGYERSSLNLSPPSATSPLQNHVRLQEREESTTKVVEEGNVFSELSGHQITFQEKPSLIMNPCSAVSSVRNDAGLLELDEYLTNLGNDENGISILAGHEPFQEKSSSTMNSCPADSSVRRDAGLLEIEECTTNLVYDENGISVLAGRVPFQENPPIDPFGKEARLLLTEAKGRNTKLADEVDSLGEEPNFLTSQEKPSSAISPPEVQGNAIRLVDDQDRHCEQENDDLSDEKPCSSIATGVVLSAEEGSSTNLVNEADGFDEADHKMYLEESASMSLVEENVMQLARNEDKPDEKPDGEEQFSTYDTVPTDAPSPQKRSKTKISKKTTATKSDVKGDSPLQTWLQDFTKFCKKQNKVEQKQTGTNENSVEDSNSQGAPSNCRKKKCRKKKVRKDSMPGNLESCNTSPETQVAMETDSGPSTTMYPSMSEFIFDDSTAGHMGSSDKEEIVLESDSLNSAESVVNRLNVFEVMEGKKHGIDNVKDDQSVSKNTLGTGENSYMEIDSEDTCTVKRSLLIDNSGDVEQPSVKKLKSESESGCNEKNERSLDTNWDKSGDLPLMANVDEVHVHHYILDLSVEFSEKIMKGNIVLFLEPRNEEVTKKQFQMTLDSSLVNIESVSEVSLPDDYKVAFCGSKQNSPLTKDQTSSGVQNGFLGDILGDKSHTPLPFKGLSYSVYGWFVQIWKPGATGKAWPRCVWIKYHTSPEGKSLTWATDQDGK